ncbi:MAG: hypothetical protein CO150_05030 [Nitrospirae bacterium CG_4_9_14_3_um_filter_53_35]|nr:MAG: hypothetical protein AUK29_03710 [Nitrospirae bacterium CG2_30_53_67]PIS36826.1 MAG: hypothetical protein COT35_09160 [Nitrospirae bacterium CG08_land_8_20_14_0_20_52_24]PIV83608.1 MAG: hypothetical protein COW52_08490 [Nitrospirae bacterium CG17_big_fil_post_rev_8_21_14_2_50_50_9]PIW85006.1 MAG: hypothetical protein COZ95_06870 [Nitrospirae bacterium CG_4_8_14_3_um_filter_50_41]PJA75287.1 MAG: hypothetical protein CO150_05030 [Nitrospirae bacterium CG_4_9_14_3_um_filter_53_35]
MLKQEFILKSPIRILQKATQGGLDKGNLGVFMARPGVGKTACLVHVALDCLFKKQKVAHIGIGESVEKIQLWYSEILSDLCKTFDMKDPKKLHEEIEQNRLILSYAPAAFTVKKLAQDLKELAEQGGVAPEVLLIDGFDFRNLDSGWDTLAAFKYLAAERRMEIWFSAQTERDANMDGHGAIPAPCRDVENFFSVILFLEPTGDTIHLKLLKDHDHPINLKLPLKLNPNTLLLLDE